MTNSKNVEQIGLCSGKGSFDSRKNDQQLSYDPYMLKDLRKAISDPERCPKQDATWIIPSDYRNHDARSHAVQREQGQFWLAVVDIDAGNPSIEKVQDACYYVFGPGTEYMVYSTASSKPGKRKYRVVAPLAMPVPGMAYKAFQQALQAEFASNEIEADPAMQRPGQLFYCPVHSEHYEHAHTEGKPWDAHERLLDAVLVQLRLEKQKELCRFRKHQELSKRIESGEFTGMGTRDNFCQRVPIQMMLETCGYEREGKNYRSPLSTTGSYSVSIVKDGRKAVSLSGSELDAGFGTETHKGALIYDSFDLLAYYYYGNNPAAALRALAKGESHV